MSHVSKLKKRIKTKKEKSKGGKERERENKNRERERERERKREREIFLSLLLSKIYRNRIVGFRRSKRQSRSTHRELLVVTKILEFVKLHEVGNFLT